MADPGDSDSDSDINVNKSNSSNIIVSDEESSFSSSDGESDKCPICLTRLGQQDLASPDSCLHTFCLYCLTEWAKNAQTCPIDRLNFKCIIVRRGDGEISQQIDISLKSGEHLPTDVEDLTYCEVCHLSNREDEMLLCDMCDCGYHMDCLNPPLYVIPLEEWYCPQCHDNAREENIDNEIDGEEVAELLNDLSDGEQLPRPRQSRQQRLVPRTRASERVRRHTQQIQLNMAEGGMSSTHSISIGKKAKKYSKRKVRVKKRKKGKKFSRKKNSQLAEKLGICSSKWSKNTFGDNSSLGTSSNFVDHRSLSLFGHGHELDVPLESDDECDIGGDGPLHMSTRARIRISTDLISRKEISEIIRRPVRRNINISHNTDSINILDSILSVQEKQFKKKSIDSEMKNVDKHTTQTPMYSGHRNDRNSDNVNNYSSNRNNNRNYPRNNEQPYSDAGNSSSYEESQLTNEQNFSENQPVNPFPFRNSGPIKFRMNVTKMGERKPPQTPPKVVTTEYNVEEESGPSTQSEETFKALEPPPEPPALLMGISLDEEDADNNLVIDDNDYYDPENVSDNDDEVEVSRPTGTAYMQSPTYGVYMGQTEDRSSPHIPVSNSNNILHPDDEGISSDEDDKEANNDCPNISLYSSTSLKISNSPKEYGPFLEHEQPQNDKSSGEAELEYIPMPPVSPEKDSSPEHEGSSPKSEDNCLESIEVIDDDSQLSVVEEDKFESVVISDDDENKSISDNDVNDVINEIYLDIERETKEPDSVENKQIDLVDVEPEESSCEHTNDINEDLGADKENQSLIGGATSEVSCATLNSSDTDLQQKETDNLNFDPISDSEEDKKKTKNKNNKSGNSPRKENISNGKNDATIAHKGNKDKENKTKVKDKESNKEAVPWKKLSKNSKDRNYRYGKGKEKLGGETDKKEKKQKRKEIELYDVRKVLEDRPRRKKDKFGRDLSKTSHSDSDSKDRSRHKKRKRSRSKQRRRSISSPRLRNRKRSRSRHRSESRNRHHSRSRHRSWSRHRSRSIKNSSRYDKNQVHSKDRYRSPVYDERETSPLPKRRAKKSKEKSIYSKIEKDYERKLLKNDKNAKKKLKIKSKDYQYSSLSPRSSLGIPVWLSPRGRTTPWSLTDISRSPSPVYTRHGPDLDTNYSNRDQEFPDYNENIALNNLTVIVKNDNSKKSKLTKRHTSRHIAAPPVKEVFASGDNILVSVNFNKDTAAEQTSQEPIKRKRLESAPIVSSKKTKNTNTIAIPDSTLTNQKSSKKGLNSKWKNRKRISRTITGINAKPVAIIDLNTSPFREIELSPKSVIVLTDSDEDKQVTKSETKKDKSPEKSKENVVVEQKPIEKNENSTQTISTMMIGGPKTPPEPVNANSKPDIISNNSCEFNSQDEDHTQSHDVRGRGPNTPPEPPRSVDTVVSETAYDPFEPTKSNSPSPPPRVDMFEDDEDDDNDNNHNHNDTSVQPLEENKTTDSQSSVSPQIVAKTITPPFLESQSSTQTDKSPEKLTNNVTNTSYTSPAVAKTPSPVQPTPIVTNNDEIIDLDDNDDSQTTAFDNGADSPYSPGEGFVDEMRGSSPDSPPVVPQAKTVLSNSQTQNKNEARSKLDTLLSILPRVKKPSGFDKVEKNNYFKSSKFSLKSKHSKQNSFNDDSVDDLPGSAVELESKNKFLEKLNRQERVIEEVKHVLKPHYNKKHITKEQYKDIMRKAVPKICHSKSGEINPQKIHSLIEAYVIKYRHSHRKQIQRIAIK